MATKSASNVIERQPVSTQASADVKGTHGMAVGTHLISFLKEKSQQVAKVNVSLKERLKEFYDFTDDDFVSYFATTRKWRDDIKAEADKAKLTVTQYRASAEGMDYVYVTLSVFDTLAKAVQTGWRPEVDRLTWTAIISEARARIESEGKRKAREETQAEIAKWVADTKVDPEVKQANLVLLNNRMKELAQTTASRTPGTPAPKKSNFQQACEMLEQFPLEDMELVYAWLGKRIKDKQGTRPTVKTEVKPEEKPTPKAPATNKAQPEQEHATAKAKAKKSRK